MTIISKSLFKPKISLKLQTISAIAAIIGAVAIPQLFHIIGKVSGLGTALGETFLPMHLPIIFVGLIAGPYAGFAAGLFGPLVSSLLTGMPGQLMLPFMMTELCSYGIIAGFLCNYKLPNIVKILISQIFGRAVRAAAIIISVYALKNNNISVSVIWNSILTGIPGLILQWSFLPLIMYRIENHDKHE